MSQRRVQPSRKTKTKCNTIINVLVDATNLYLKGAELAPKFVETYERDSFVSEESRLF